MTSRRDVTGMMARKGYLNETAFFPSKVNPRYFFFITNGYFIGSSGLQHV